MTWPLFFDGLARWLCKAIRGWRRCPRIPLSLHPGYESGKLFFFLLFHRRFNLPAHGFQYLDAREVFVVGFHQRPRRDFGAGAIHHVAHGMLVFVPFLAVAPVLFGDLETLEADLFARLETPELFILADGEPELDHHDIVAHQLRLEVVDLTVSAHPVSFRAVALDALDQHAAIPGTVENRHPVAPRDMPPETPQVGLGALFLGGRGDRDDVVLARIQRAGDAADRAALAGSIVTLEHGDDGDVLELRAARQQRELALVFFQLDLKIFLVYFLAEIQRLQNMQLVDRRKRRRRGNLRYFFTGFIQTLADGVENDLAHGQAAVARIEPLDDGPRRFGRAGVAHHAFAYDMKLVVHLVTFPVAFSDAPAGLRVFFKELEAFFLLLLGQVHPELEDQRAFIHQHRFEAFGALQALVEVGRLGAAGHPVEYRPGVPGAEKYANLAFGRQLAPEPPHHRAIQFLIRWLAHAVGLDKARIHPLVEQVDGFAPPRAIHTAHQNDDRKFRQLGQIQLRFQQRLAQRRHFLVVSLLVYLVTEFG